MVKFPLIRRQKTRCSYNLKEFLIIPLSSFCAVKQKIIILFCCLGLDKRLITFQSTESHSMLSHSLRDHLNYNLTFYRLIKIRGLYIVY